MRARSSRQSRLDSFKALQEHARVDTRNRDTSAGLPVPAWRGGPAFRVGMGVAGGGGADGSRQPEDKSRYLCAKEQSCIIVKAVVWSVEGAFRDEQ